MNYNDVKIIAITDPHIVGSSIDSIGYIRIDCIQYKVDFINVDLNACYTKLIFYNLDKNLIPLDNIFTLKNVLKNGTVLLFKYIIQPEDLILSMSDTGIRTMVNKDKIFKKDDIIGYVV